MIAVSKRSIIRSDVVASPDGGKTETGYAVPDKDDYGCEDDYENDYACGY